MRVARRAWPGLRSRCCAAALVFLAAGIGAQAARADWSEPVTLADSTASRYSSTAAADPNGDAVVIWTHYYDEYTTSVEGAWRTAGGPWSPWVTLSGPIMYLAGGGGNATQQETWR